MVTVGGHFAIRTKKSLFPDEVAAQLAALQAQYVPIVDTAAPIRRPDGMLVVRLQHEKIRAAAVWPLILCASCTNTHRKGRWGVLGGRIPITCRVCNTVGTGYNANLNLVHPNLYSPARITKKKDSVKTVWYCK